MLVDLDLTGCCDDQPNESLNNDCISGQSETKADLDPDDNPIEQMSQSGIQEILEEAPLSIQPSRKELLKRATEASLRWKKDAQQNGFTAQAFDAIDAYRSANKPKHNKKRRDEYAQQIEKTRGRTVRIYSEASSVSRTEQNRLAQQRRRAKRTDEEITSDREANKLRSRLAREVKARSKLP